MVDAIKSGKHLTTSVVPAGQRPKIPTETPQQKLQAQQQARADQQGSSTSYQEMLKDAYDSNDEATLVGQSGRRTSDKPDEQVPAEIVPVRRKRPVPAEPAQPAEATDNAMLSSLRRKKAQPDMSVGATERAPLTSARSAHDQLMLAASQMDPSETATHVSLKSFSKAMDVLSRDNWSRATDGANRLMRSQMSTVQAAGAR